MKETNTREKGPSLVRLFTLAALALVAIAIVAGNAGNATAGPNGGTIQLWSVQAKDLSRPADRLDVAFGKPDQALKVEFAFAFSETSRSCFAEGFLSNHIKDVNAPPLINHEVWTFLFPEKCLQSGDEILVEPFSVDPNNHLVIKEALLYNQSGTLGRDNLADDVVVGTGNPTKIDWRKFPRLQNLWLCSAPSDFCGGRDGLAQPDGDHAGSVAFVAQVLTQPITSADPKCTGFPNFLPDAECPRQQLGSFEYEVRFDAKYIDVQLLGLFDFVPPELGLGTCLHNYGEGFAQIACVTKGKEFSIPLGFLSELVITPKPDDFSLLRANQDNGIVVQLINQDCNLSDLQGHPIPLEGEVCGDGAVTIRYLEGDVHADCVIDVRDQQQIAFRWGSHVGQLLYNSIFDLEPSSPKLGDGDIDAKDLQTVFGRHESNCFSPHPAQDPVDPKAKVEPIPIPDTAPAP